VLASLLVATPTGVAPAPLRLAVFYGYPTLINGSAGDVARAATEFGRYDVVVLGDGLQMPRADASSADAQEHRRSRALIERLRLESKRPEILGYIALGDTQRLGIDDVVDRIEAWRQMGVDGIFLDEAGYDFGVTRERQNAAVRAAHARGMWACLNAFRPADVFDDAVVPVHPRGGGNPAGVAPALTARDAILLESFAVANGRPEPPGAMKQRALAALEGRRRLGTRIFAVATATRSEDLTLARYGWWSAALFGLDAYGWAAPNYSADTSVLPFVEPPAAERALRGGFAEGQITFAGDRWSRDTKAGRIVVDVAARTGALESR
jgi:hypothetical protein